MWNMAYEIAETQVDLEMLEGAARPEVRIIAI